MDGSGKEGPEAEVDAFHVRYETKVIDGSS